MGGKLDGKVAVITGASKGIGLATAKLFVAEGAHVFITGRRQAVLDAAVREIGADVTAVRGDAANPADLDRLFEVVRREKGRIDVLYASAGISQWVPLSVASERDFDATFDLNVRGTFFTVQKALPLLKDGASIIMTGSIAAAKGYATISIYSASKAALRSFARTWTMELKDRKIRVNVLSPGYVDTDALAGMTKEALERSLAAVPMARLGQPEEIAKAALFLASDDSSFVTGIELFADGGTAQV